jgi:hypothetical protein
MKLKEIVPSKLDNIRKVNLRKPRHVSSLESLTASRAFRLIKSSID